MMHIDLKVNMDRFTEMAERLLKQKARYTALIKAGLIDQALFEEMVGKCCEISEIKLKEPHKLYQYVGENNMEVGPFDLKQAIQELYYWQYCDATNFTAKLYELISKADPANRARLRTAFPAEVYAFLLWSQADAIEDFFKIHRVWPTSD